jgi:hypothetical protein
VLASPVLEKSLLASLSDSKETFSLWAIPRLEFELKEGEGTAYVGMCIKVQILEAGPQVLTRTMVPSAGITWQAGTAERAPSVVNATGLSSGSAGVTAILAGVGRWGNH